MNKYRTVEEVEADEGKVLLGRYGLQQRPRYRLTDGTVVELSIHFASKAEKYVVLTEKYIKNHP